MRKIILYAACACLAVTSGLFGVHFDVNTKFKITDLGTLESDNSIATDVNDHEQACGYYDFEGKRYPFLYDPTEGIQVLDLPYDATPQHINNQGQIIGQYKLEGGYDRAFFWDPTNGFADIGTLGGRSSCAKALNDYGQVVGNAETSGGKFHAFSWRAGEMTDLGVLHGEMDYAGDFSSAEAINNRGEIVGMALYPLIHKGKVAAKIKKAVVWRDGGQIEQLDPDFKSEVSNILGITESGYAVVVKGPSGGHGERIGVNIHSGAQTPALPGNVAVNDRLMSVWAHGIGAPEFNLYGEIRRFRNAHWGPSLKDSKSIWIAFEATGLNNEGVICGKGTTIYGEKHAVLLTPLN